MCNNLFICLFLIVTATGISMANDSLQNITEQVELNQNDNSNSVQKVKILKKGKSYDLHQNDINAIISIIPETLKSCQDREKRMGTEMLWKKWIKSGSCIHICYDRPQAFDLDIKPQLIINELLIFLSPVSLEGKILTKHNDTYYSPFIGCDINQLKNLKFTN